jgi:hypothetical protein
VSRKGRYPELKNKNFAKGVQFRGDLSMLPANGVPLEQGGHGPQCPSANDSGCQAKG